MWIQGGSLVEAPVGANGGLPPDKVLFEQMAMVRITTDSMGTSVQWSMACANWASLMLAAKLLAACVAPVQLKYFNAGWFTETEDSVQSAANRIDQLIAKSDVRIADRAYTSVAMPEHGLVPEPLQRALRDGTIDNDFAVICAVEPERESCVVEHVGSQSLIGSIWGVAPNSYPCLNGHGYDRAVTPEYFRVVTNNRPHYSHVLASMVRPNGELHWIGYHRVILPDLQPGKSRVRVVSALAPVHIQLL
jgi:hypothetical protein